MPEIELNKNERDALMELLTVRSLDEENYKPNELERVEEAIREERKVEIASVVKKLLEI